MPEFNSTPAIYTAYSLGYAKQLKHFCSNPEAPWAHTDLALDVAPYGWAFQSVSFTLFVLTVLFRSGLAFPFGAL